MTEPQTERIPKVVSSEIVRRVNEVMHRGFEIPMEKLTPEAQILGEMGLDSLDAIDMLVYLEEELGGLQNDVKEVYTDAKDAGMNPKRIREIIALRRKDKEKLREEKEEREMYMLALDPELADVLS